MSIRSRWPAVLLATLALGAPNVAAADMFPVEAVAVVGCAGCIAVGLTIAAVAGIVTAILRHARKRRGE